MHYVVGIVPFGLVACIIVPFTVWRWTRYDGFSAFVLRVDVKKFWTQKLSDMSGFKHRLCEVRKFPSRKVQKCCGFTHFAVSSILKNEGNDRYVLWMTRDMTSHRLAVISVSVQSPWFLDFLWTKSNVDRFLGKYLSFPHHCHSTDPSGSFCALLTLF